MVKGFNFVFTVQCIVHDNKNCSMVLQTEQQKMIFEIQKFCLPSWMNKRGINNFFYVFNKVFNIYNIDILEVIEMYFFSTSYYWTFHLFHITLCVCMFHYCCFELRLIFCPYGSGVQGCQRLTIQGNMAQKILRFSSDLQDKG